MPVIERPDISGQIPGVGSPGILVPIDYAREIIKGAGQSSFALRNFRTQRMPAYVQVMPVLTALPVADWVSEQPLTGTGSDKTKKPTTEPGFETAVLQAEECAAIVVVPEAVLYDSSIDLWAELRPLLTDALGRLVDEAVLFGGTAGGGKKPASWPDGVVATALADGIPEDSPDLIGAISEAMALIEESGGIPNLIGGGPNLLAKLRSMRDGNDRPLYLDNVRTDTNFGSMLGVSIDIARNGAWDSEKATAAVFDTSTVIIGIREDITFRPLDQATIDVSPNRDGSQMVYLAQQDCVALRVRYRLAYTTVSPMGGYGVRLRGAADVVPAPVVP